MPTGFAGGNFAFEGRFNPPTGPIFRCIYHIDAVSANGGVINEVSFTLMDGPKEGCSRGTFKRKAKF